MPIIHCADCHKAVAVARIMEGCVYVCVRCLYAGTYADPTTPYILTYNDGVFLQRLHILAEV